VRRGDCNDERAEDHACLLNGNRCGWLADKFGLPWQIAPRALPEMLQSGGAARTQRVMRAVFEMKKLDIAKFHQAFGPIRRKGHERFW
jgi:predicted 3-demethylubiquinone-9 3-methyltransferase (glyoxalase superfamily)